MAEGVHDVELKERVRRLHEDAFIFDALTTSVIDEPFVDILRTAGVDATNYTVSAVSVDHGVLVQDDFERACRSIARWLRIIKDLDHSIGLARSVADMRALHRERRFAVFFGFQNASPIEDNLDYLDVFYELGVRFIQLTYNARNMVGNGSGERTDEGLSDFGVSAVERMNELGIVVDLSHCHYRTTMDAIECSAMPVAFTHANARALADTPRNKSDEQVIALAEKGGIVGIKHMLGNTNTKPADETTVEDLVDHLDHFVRLVGIDHVCIGTDFAGVSAREATHEERIAAIRSRWPNAYVGKRARPKGFESIADLPNLTAALMRRGYSDADIRKVYGENMVRFLEIVLRA